MGVRVSAKEGLFCREAVWASVQPLHGLPQV